MKLVLALAAAATLAASPARAAPPTFAAPPGPPSSVEHESGLALKQMLLGEAAAVAVPLALGLGLHWNVDDWILWTSIAAATPLAVGATICAVGNLSWTYDGSCLPPIAGAALGSLTTVGLVLLSERLGDPGSDVNLAPPVFVVLGWFVLQPALSFAGWQRFRRPRSLPAPPAFVFAPPPAMGRGGGRLAGETTLPLLAFAF